MSHLRSGFSGVSVPIGADGSSHNTITNNITMQVPCTQGTCVTPKCASPLRSSKLECGTEAQRVSGTETGTGVQEVSDGVYVVYPEHEQQGRDVKEAEDRLNEIKKTQPDSERLIEALNMIIEMYYNNPLYINKWVVAESDVLAKLIGALTDAERVDITITDPTCACVGCCGSSDTTIATIDTIYVVKGGDTMEFRYSYPGAKKILDDCHISTRLLVQTY